MKEPTVETMDRARDFIGELTQSLQNIGGVQSTRPNSKPQNSQNAKPSVASSAQPMQTSNGSGGIPVAPTVTSATASAAGHFPLPLSVL